MNRHQKDWWEGILVMDLFESVTICKFREGNSGANTFSHGNFIIRDKKCNKWCFSHGFWWNRHYIYIYIYIVIFNHAINWPWLYVNL